MESTLIEFDEKVAELKDHVDQLKDYIGDIAVSKKIRDGFKSFYMHLDKYSTSTDNEDIENIASSAKTVALYGQTIGQGIAQFEEADNQMKSLGSVLLDKASSFRNWIEKSPLEIQPMEFINSNNSNLSLASFQSVKNNMKKLANDHLEHDKRIKKLLTEGESNANNLKIRIEKIERDVEVEIEKITSLYKDSLAEIEAKKQQIDDILGHVSGRAVAGDFETSSAEEKKMANWLRYSSLACMAFIVCVVGYSFWETTTTEFHWQNSVFRIVLAIMLSVPAAYLTRESAKHREQQYSHLQTSLDLKAISPYIASLPIDEQHKIKIEVASRLFAARDYSKVGADPYPVNVHEIVMELIKKLELNKQTKSDKSG
ncbi:hypothetical protein ABMY44_10695 [Pseudoalteromonas sp. Cnat2-41]|uniref:hypothetical protein n=1 Tax=unclassified Pseudoalteromonas TaxID=194690 RepID=UPI001EF81B48|nr:MULTISPECIES: hypothetical protein [unclassified Pseudoalteromonas]MCF2863541.1 hypothetical protein [Pseudoalteromonas sp. CNAT2-18]MCG7558494.1 hypothetical protein [Pseudoalteromonas sp. CNAT2-18.1]